MKSVFTEKIWQNSFVDRAWDLIGKAYNYCDKSWPIINVLCLDLGLLVFEELLSEGPWNLVCAHRHSPHSHIEIMTYFFI